VADNIYGTSNSIASDFDSATSERGGGVGGVGGTSDTI